MSCNTVLNFHHHSITPTGSNWLSAVLGTRSPDTNMAHPEHDHNNKRKRDADDNGQQPHDRIPQPPPPQSGTFTQQGPVVGFTNKSPGNGAHINYLAKNPIKLQLIQGDAEVFSDVLGLIGDYEGVLSRQESLAANLGAKLTGPRLVRAMEGLFEGSITISQRDPYNSSPVTWMDIVQFAKANPAEFTLTSSDRGRFCTFYLKGNQVEITEDDWRLIVSEALDRFNLAQPLDEDENCELATLEILEQRIHVLIKKADEVARKARQLNYHLSGRKSAITSRRTTAKSPPLHHSGFQPANHQQVQSSRPSSTYNLHDDLLQQFTTASASQIRPQTARIPQSSVSLPTTPVIQQGPSHNSTVSKPLVQPVQTSSRPSPSTAPAPMKSTLQPRPEDPSSAYRPLITARIEKLTKGEAVHPPCDRCRRLHITCIKYLTACQGCTKKHAKCNWKSITEEEIAWLKGAAASGEMEGEGEDSGSRSGGAQSPEVRSASPVSVVEMRSFAPTNIISQNRPGSGSGGNGPPVGDRSLGGGAAPTQERPISEFGLREHHHHHHPPIDHYRLSHMASVALSSDRPQSNSEQQQQQPQQPQKQHVQSAILSGGHASRE